MKEPTLTYDQLVAKTELTNREQFRLTIFSDKAEEVYLMKKFIHIFKLYHCGTQVQCFNWINDFRASKGLPSWKSTASVCRYWNASFNDLDMEYHDFCNYE